MRLTAKFTFGLVLAAALALLIAAALLKAGLSLEQRRTSAPHPAAAAAHRAEVVATWAVDPTVPGPDLPPVGRSLFDFVVTPQQGGAYQVPFPFPALLAQIERRVQAGAGQSPLKIVLLPHGRALLRNTASPDFFKYPRAVAVVDSEPTASGMLLKDRLYLGYGAKADVLEVISYNEAAGRFEFQVVKDYRAGAQPQVFYANRDVCTACHQNGAPIFSRPLWQETNANPQVAAQLLRHGSDFYGVAVARGIDVPAAIDAATARANLLAAYQLLWQQGCDGGNAAAAVQCRADAFTFMLQYRLSGQSGFDQDSAQFRSAFFPAFAKNWRQHWPRGLAIAQPNVPNRDPLAAGGTQVDANIPARLEPLDPRAPLEIWSEPQPADMERIVAGLAGFIAEPDVRALDAQLFQRGSQAATPRRNYRGACTFGRKEMQAGAYRLDFNCREPEGGGGFGAEGRIYVEAGKVARGSVDRLVLRDGGELHDLDTAGGKVVAAQGTAAAELHLFRGALHARVPGGRAVESLQLHWPTGPATESSGSGTVAVMDDFAALRQAVAALAAQTQSGALDVLGAKPLRRAALMPALFAQLGMAPTHWCCVADTGMPPARLDADRYTSVDPHPAINPAASPALRPFYRYCANCHQSRDTLPPNFLYGDAAQVSAKLAQCAPRIHYRLAMWQLAAPDRPKTPMPPALALHGFGLTEAQWNGNADLASLRRSVEAMLKTRTGKVPKLGDYARLPYESLPACLAAAG
jgi:hypothetical protein